MSTKKSKPHKERIVNASIPLNKCFEHHKGKHVCLSKTVTPSPGKCGLKKSQCKGEFMAWVLEASHTEEKGVIVLAPCWGIVG
jgi:hypothetical protein